MKFHFAMNPNPDQLIRKLRGDLTGAKRAGMTNVVTTVESKAVVGTPVKTGNLARGGTTTVNADGTKGTVTFTAKGNKGQDYAELVHEGTGIYGPRKTPIVPRAKKALFWPGANHPVRSVSGMRPRPFLRRAAEEADVAQLYVEGADNYLKGAK